MSPVCDWLDVDTSRPGAWTEGSPCGMNASFFYWVDAQGGFLAARCRRHSLRKVADREGKAWAFFSRADATGGVRVSRNAWSALSEAEWTVAATMAS